MLTRIRVEATGPLEAAQAEIRAVFEVIHLAAPESWLHGEVYTRPDDSLIDEDTFHGRALIGFPIAPAELTTTAEAFHAAYAALLGRIAG